MNELKDYSDFNFDTPKDKKKSSNFSSKKKRTFFTSTKNYRISDFQTKGKGGNKVSSTINHSFNEEERESQNHIDNSNRTKVKKEVSRTQNMFEDLKREEQREKGNEDKDRKLDKEKENIYYVYDQQTQKLSNRNKLTDKERVRKIENQLNQSIKEWEKKYRRTEEEKKRTKERSKRKRRIKKMLTSKGLNFQEFLNFVDKGKDYEDWLEDNFTGEYKTLEQRKRIKLRTLTSLKNYEKFLLEDKQITSKSKKKICKLSVRLQEKIYKIPAANREELTLKDLNDLLKEQVERTREEGSEVLAAAVHNDESGRHIHIFKHDKDFELLQKEMKNDNKEMKTNFKYEKMSKEELTKYREMKQRREFKDMNKILDKNGRGIEVKRRHHVHDNLSNEERMLKNGTIQKQKNVKVKNRLFNNMNLKKKQAKEAEKLLNHDKEINVKLRLLLKQFSNIIKEKNIKLVRDKEGEIIEAINDLKDKDRREQRMFTFQRTMNDLWANGPQPVQEDKKEE